MTGRDPAAYRSSVTLPPDFDRFWQDTLAEAAEVPLNPRLEPVPLRSTPDVEVFDVRWDSLDGLSIAGWYCRPRHRIGKLAALIHVPGYVSEPLLPRPSALQGYCALSVAPRGKLRSNDRFNPGYPGLLTHNIDAPTLTDTYAYQEINDYLRLYPDREPAVRRTLDYFDGINFAPKIRCPIIVNIGLEDDICAPETGYAVFRAIGSADKRLYTYEGCGHDAGLFVGHAEIVSAFLARHLRPAEPA